MRQTPALIKKFMMMNKSFLSKSSLKAPLQRLLKSHHGHWRHIVQLPSFIDALDSRSRSSDPTQLKKLDS